ncbi:substrate-binding domain-containing protein [Dactylosporangium sp. NPDC049525]|uniref:substrate-binding domain-containing protein n=1 Tax=Dactylosporangium sp. NPDC049525 TaxID=3154730 RepID=UPI0034198B06
MRGKSIIASCLAAALIAAAVPGTARAAVPHQRIAGTGSSYAANAINAWVAQGQLRGLQADYTPTGSASGRKDFAVQVTDFGVSDLPFRGVDPMTGQRDDAQGRPYAYAPLVAGAVTFPYQLRVGGQLVRDVRLSGLTLAKIFLGQITNWNDPLITADNGRQLPWLPIIVVVHAEASGVTAQLTAYIAKQFPSLWQEYSGTSVYTEYFPTTPRTGTRPRPLAVSGSDGVMNTVRAGSSNGAIGYDEYTYALAAGSPVAKVGNAAGYFIAPDPLNVSLSLTRATLNPDLTANLDAVYAFDDPRVYPLSGYTYLILPTGADDARMTTAKRQTLVDFFAYTACAGQAGISPLGYAPLPLNLVRAQFDQLRKLHDADPAVDVSTLDPANCANPTFIPGDLTRDLLGEIVPMPQGGPALPPGTVPVEAQNDTAPYAGSVGISVALGTRVSLTQVDPAAPGGHPAQATDPTGHRHAWVFEGALDGVAVLDTRPPQPGWTVTGQATDMVNGATTVAARNVGWSPTLVTTGSDAEGTVAPGATVPPALQDATSPGLSEAGVLARAAPGTGLGVQQVGATMRLWMPDTSPKGHYTGMLTLTLISA